MTYVSALIIVTTDTIPSKIILIKLDLPTVYIISVLVKLSSFHQKQDPQHPPSPPTHADILWHLA